MSAPRYRDAHVGGCVEATIEHRADGSTLGRSTDALLPFPQRFTDRLEHWAQQAPERTFVAQRDAVGAWRRLRTDARAREDGEWPLRVADDYLMAVGHPLMSWAWARIARCACDPSRAPAAGGRSAVQWFDAARFGVEWLLPQAAMHWTRVRRSDAALPFVG